jgi:hypothetical protein
MTEISWTNVQTWIESNPQSHKTLSPFKWARDKIEGADEVKEADGWSRITVSPSTPLSAILLSQDTMYQALPEHARMAVLRDETTELQESCARHLKGRQWPIRRTNEGITTCGLTEGRSSDWTDIGWRALATLRECQLIVVNQTAQTIRFFPEDVRCWSSSNETIWIDHECRYIWSYASKPNVKGWLTTKEQAGWSLQWPEADGTMEELKQAAQKVGDNILGKITKDVLMKRVGRAQSIHTLSSWVSGV